MATITGQTLPQLTLSVVEKDVENSYRQYISKKIQNMIDSLKSKKNISDYHEKILKLEHMKKKIIMQKYYE